MGDEAETAGEAAETIEGGAAVAQDADIAADEVVGVFADDEDVLDPIVIEELEVVVVEDLRRAWWLLALLGVLSVGAGILLIVWPGPTITTIATVIGLFMIATGIVKFFVALAHAWSSERWLMVLSAMVSIVTGTIIVKSPQLTIAIIVVIAAIFWMVAGMVDLFRGLSDRDLPDRAPRIVLGAVTILFALVMLAWPAVTVAVFAMMMGIYVAIFGILEIMAALKLRKA